MLAINDLVKIYGRGKNAKRAVDTVSLSVPKGSFFGLLGPNGAGKSTIIGCTIGTTNITSGSIAVDGCDVVKEYRQARRKIGISPQDFNVDVFENVYLLIDYMAGFYGVPKDQRASRIKTLVERFELGEHTDKRFMELSGGLKRRLILARALVHDPDLLILDEPTAGIDVEQRHDLWRYLQELNEEGKAIILTSHYLEEIELLCNRVAIINRGRIVSDKPKEEYTGGGRSLEERYLEITKGSQY